VGNGTTVPKCLLEVVDCHCSIFTPTPFLFHFVPFFLTANQRKSTLIRINENGIE